MNQRTDNVMDRVLFGDNQFFGVNHMSEEKARAQQMRFQDLQAIIDLAWEGRAEISAINAPQVRDTVEQAQLRLQRGLVGLPALFLEVGPAHADHRARSQRCHRGHQQRCRCPHLLFAHLVSMARRGLFWSGPRILGTQATKKRPSRVAFAQLETRLFQRAARAGARRTTGAGKSPSSRAAFSPWSAASAAAVFTSVVTSVGLTVSTA